MASVSQQPLLSSNSHMFSDESAEAWSNWILCISEEKIEIYSWASHINVHKWENTDACMFQRLCDSSYLMTNLGYNMEPMLNRPVRTHAAFTAEPVVHHSAHHSRAIKNPGERRHAIKLFAACTRCRFSSFCLPSVSQTLSAVHYQRVISSSSVQHWLPGSSC